MDIMTGHMLFKPLKVYLDTSVFNFAIPTQDVPREKEATLKFLEAIKTGKFIAYISQVTIDEILKAGEKRRNDLFKVVKEISPEELPVTDEADTLADSYIESKILPANERNDALHIAVATIHNLDVIISWNFEHMVKLKTRRDVPAINALMNYKPIEICSPLEVVQP